MKKTFIVMALGALLLSCNPGGEITQLKKENDSLRQELVNCQTHGRGARNGASTGNSVVQGDSVLINDTDLVDTSSAKILLQNWATYLNKTNANPVLQTWMNCRAFVVPLADIDSAADRYSNTTAFIFYIGLSNDDSTLSLMWSPLTGPAGQYRELFPALTGSPVNGTLWDHTMPCPKCGILNPLAIENPIYPLVPPKGK
jgi:hypothetical protein